MQEKAIKFKINRISYCSSELITFVCSLYFTLACNYSFWNELLQGKELTSPHTWFIIFCTATAITGLHWFLLLLVVNRWTFKWLTISLLLITSLAVYFMSSFHVYIDPTMIINVVSTDYHESVEFLQWRILPYFLFLGVLPSFFIWFIKINKRGLASYWAGRLGTILLSLCMLFGGTWAVFHELGPTLREKKQIIYLITPLNMISSSTKAYWRAQQAKVDKTKIKIGTDAHQLPRPQHSKPRVIILVVGETVRAFNWGLNGYHRQTTPELAKHKVINFSQVTSCGTTTAVSLPCMFSPYGIHNYNNKKINQSESLLHLLDRAKIAVTWRDNQSGCKGVCEGLPFEKLNVEALCKNGRCFDEVLLHQLQDQIISKKEDQLIVLHMLGNHGPAYFERYPKQFKYWTPTCDTSDLSTCSQKALVNTYDNAILYTDSILAHAIDVLENIKSHDTGLIYVSDHGESLGERNLFLHGLPYFMAPDEQTKVPMIVWLSQGLSKQLTLKETCLRDKQSSPISHDYLFSTLLSFFDVKTKEYNPKFDLTHPCRTI
ncbi:phosphoethanolamine--lipid A transferase [Fluoribacter dumoffii]|uniref:Phosphoethanolamine transferase eptA n=1 Tax=Fluoribacter dumoffii TaxID=463 RepID=A0A377G9S3_9GAMM|nr:phosphoethanolamine--lipid A transferase [Fluoribacter dumoffii]KTC90133.1 sulfatase [Fluoribacter dumoffii NY 23]MCW8385429.1 phosphoethanolamine--lipid A transferase [Fluoribacter dumoffii]MCW8496274.1 phosphoethanolamine--lipid A transferase [Fluoribacter dumoffii]STO21250.1 Phosphoethanolamine transferase eptA [Fluoribacter dumoffii]